MATRRMFNKTIIDTDEFLDMPISARLLYFDLGMRADDDGFVSPKRIMRITNANNDDLKILLAKKYVINFENKVLVIRDWKVNNFIRPDRYTPTIYQEYLKRLQLTSSNQYQLKVLNSGIPDDIPDDIPDGGIGKVRLGKSKVRIDIAEASSASSLKKKKFDDTPMILQEFVESCKNSPQRHIQIVGGWAEAVEPNYTIKGQWDSFIRRNVRPAKNLIAFTDEQLQEAFDRLQKDIVKIDKNTGKKVGFITKFTLETLEKYL